MYSAAPRHPDVNSLHRYQPTVEECDDETMSPFDVPKSFRADCKDISSSTTQLNVIYEELGKDTKQFKNPRSIQVLRGKFQAQTSREGPRSAEPTLPRGNETTITLQELLQWGRGGMKKVFLSSGQDSDSDPRAVAEEAASVSSESCFAPPEDELVDDSPAGYIISDQEDRDYADDHGDERSTHAESRQLAPAYTGQYDHDYGGDPSKAGSEVEDSVCSEDVPLYEPLQWRFAQPRKPESDSDSAEEEYYSCHGTYTGRLDSHIHSSAVAQQMQPQFPDPPRHSTIAVGGHIGQVRSETIAPPALLCRMNIMERTIKILTECIEALTSSSNNPIRTLEDPRVVPAAEPADAESISASRPEREGTLDAPSFTPPLFASKSHTVNAHRQSNAFRHIQTHGRHQEPLGRATDQPRCTVAPPANPSYQQHLLPLATTSKRKSETPRPSTSVHTFKLGLETASAGNTPSRNTAGAAPIHDVFRVGHFNGTWGTLAAWMHRLRVLATLHGEDVIMRSIPGALRGKALSFIMSVPARRYEDCQSLDGWEKLLGSKFHAGVYKPGTRSGSVKVRTTGSLNARSELTN